MPTDRLTIDPATLFDNPTDLRVEFVADVGDERHAFAVPYDTLRAVSGVDPVTEPVALLQRYAEQIAAAGAKALANDSGREIVVIGEADL